MDELATLLESAQAGHRDAREKIIKRFHPLVIKTASSLSGRYIDTARDDEISIGMLAINQAIDTFKPQGGTSFFSYAEMLIKRRLIDYYRKEQRLSKAVPFSCLGPMNEQEENQNTISQIEHNLAMIEFQKKQEEIERREEIKQYTKRLKEYGIALTDLVANSPKHEDARLRALEVARLVATRSELKLHLEMKKELPLKQIEELVAVSRKTLERQRKYIIAMTIVICGEFNYLKEYLQKNI
ncbi:RNA polymerase sigma-I factor [Candidatus Formimonas warabiya]|uniref:RNA polymerase sigma-I factor n=1 Tax=Formimonas warabiya TaxID=1761012 RepID=UPI001BE42A83|nr:RNA polymerase sigma-I factor [Candidatus Formimonas warabiya]